METTTSRLLTPRLLLLIVVCGLGGFLFGYDTGIVSGAMIFIVDEYNLTPFIHELVISITIGFAAVVPLTLGFCSRFLGRRTLMAVSATLFSIGSCILGLATSVTMLLIGRSIVGMGIGVVSTITPIYLSECAPAQIRGAMVTFYNFTIILGQMSAYLVALAFAGDVENGWRFMLGLGAIPAIIQIVGLTFLPETPRYVVAHGDASEAVEIIRKLRPTGYDVTGEVDQLTASISTDEENKGSFETLQRIMKTDHVRRALFIGCGMQMFQQLVGINTVMYYCASIVQMAGVPDKRDALLYSALITAVYGIIGVAVLFFIDTVGRRKMLIGSSIGCTVGLAMLSIAFVVVSLKAPNLTYSESGTAVHDSCTKITDCNDCAFDANCGVCYEDVKGHGLVPNGSCVEVDKKSQYPNYYASHGRCEKSAMTSSNSTVEYITDACPSNYAALIIISIGVYLLSFSFGYGPIPWVFNSEIYPLWARATAVSLATTTNWTFNLIISLTFLTLVDAITQSGAFAVYAFICVLSVAFYVALMPETKEVPLEEIGHLFGLKYERQDNSASDNDVSESAINTTGTGQGIINSNNPIF